SGCDQCCGVQRSIPGVGGDLSHDTIYIRMRRIVPRDEKNIENEIDALFALPVADFTGARNALAARLKKDGRTNDAERVKSLQKPPVSAWAVNQLYWRHREAFDRLLATGEQFRKAQASQLSGKAVDLVQSRDPQ